jgi:hypothetical protein
LETFDWISTRSRQEKFELNDEFFQINIFVFLIIFIFPNQLRKINIMPNKFFFLVCLGLLEKNIYGVYGVTSDILLITL